jgi:hypothetical protein
LNFLSQLLKFFSKSLLQLIDIQLKNCDTHKKFQLFYSKYPLTDNSSQKFSPLQNRLYSCNDNFCICKTAQINWSKKNLISPRPKQLISLDYHWLITPIAKKSKSKNPTSETSLSICFQKPTFHLLHKTFLFYPPFSFVKILFPMAGTKCKMYVSTCISVFRKNYSVAECHLPLTGPNDSLRRSH